MDQQISKKKGGRRALPCVEKRKKVTLMLTRGEIERLQTEFEGHAVGFSVFCREKLLNREAITLSKPMDKEIRMQLTHLLKFSGSLLLLAQKTRDDVPVSDDFRLMASQLKEIVKRAHYTVNEITYSQSLVIQVHSAVVKMDGALGTLVKNRPEDRSLKMLADLQKQLLEALQTYFDRYDIKSTP